MIRRVTFESGKIVDQLAAAATEKNFAVEIEQRELERDQEVDLLRNDVTKSSDFTKHQQKATNGPQFQSSCSLKIKRQVQKDYSPPSVG